MSLLTLPVFRRLTMTSLYLVLFLFGSITQTTKSVKSSAEVTLTTSKVSVKGSFAKSKKKLSPNCGGRRRTKGGPKILSKNCLKRQRELKKASEIAASPGSSCKKYLYNFEFSDVNTTEVIANVNGQSDSTTVLLTVGDFRPFPVDVDCSDTFPNGFGSKAGPIEGVHPFRVSSWSVYKYDSNCQIVQTCAVSNVFTAQEEHCDFSTTQEADGCEDSSQTTQVSLQDSNGDCINGAIVALVAKDNSTDILATFQATSSNCTCQFAVPNPVDQYCLKAIPSQGFQCLGNCTWDIPIVTTDTTVNVETAVNVSVVLYSKTVISTFESTIISIKDDYGSCIDNATVKVVEKSNNDAVIATFYSTSTNCTYSFNAPGPNWKYCIKVSPPPGYSCPGNCTTDLPASNSSNSSTTATATVVVLQESTYNPLPAPVLPPSKKPSSVPTSPPSRPPSKSVQYVSESSTGSPSVKPFTNPVNSNALVPIQSVLTWQWNFTHSESITTVTESQTTTIVVRSFSGSCISDAEVEIVAKDDLANVLDFFKSTSINCSWSVTVPSPSWLYCVKITSPSEYCQENCTSIVPFHNSSSTAENGQATLVAVLASSRLVSSSIWSWSWSNVLTSVTVEYQTSTIIVQNSFGYCVDNAVVEIAAKENTSLIIDVFKTSSTNCTWSFVVPSPAWKYCIRVSPPFNCNGTCSTTIPLTNTTFTSNTTSTCVVVLNPPTPPDKVAPTLPPSGLELASILTSRPSVSPIPSAVPITTSPSSGPVPLVSSNTTSPTVSPKPSLRASSQSPTAYKQPIMSAVPTNNMLTSVPTENPIASPSSDEKGMLTSLPTVSPKPSSNVPTTSSPTIAVQFVPSNTTSPSVSPSPSSTMTPSGSPVSETTDAPTMLHQPIMPPSAADKPELLTSSPSLFPVPSAGPATSSPTSATPTISTTTTPPTFSPVEQVSLQPTNGGRTATPTGNEDGGPISTASPTVSPQRSAAKTSPPTVSLQPSTFSPSGTTQNVSSNSKSPTISPKPSTTITSAPTVSPNPSTSSPTRVEKVSSNTSKSPSVSPKPSTTLTSTPSVSPHPSSFSPTGIQKVSSNTTSPIYLPTTIPNSAPIKLEAAIPSPAPIKLDATTASPSRSPMMLFVPTPMKTESATLMPSYGSQCINEDQRCTFYKEFSSLNAAVDKVTLCKHIIAGGLKDFLCPALQATCEGMSCNCECTEFFSYCYSDCSEEDSGSNEFAPGLPLSTTSNPSAAPTSSPTFACNNMSPTERYQNILAILAAVTEEKLLSDSTSPQARALQWITTEDEARVCPSDIESLIQRYAIATLYFSTTGEDWRYCSAEPSSSECPEGEEKAVTLSNNWVCDAKSTRWLTSSSECSWCGVSCDDCSRVTKIVISSNYQAGMIPPEIGLLTHLLILQMDDGLISGDIPTTIQNLKNLTVLDLNSQALNGPIPDNVYNLHKLEELDINKNKLSGPLSSKIGRLSALSKLNVSDNIFSGSIPEELGLLTNLEFADFYYNKFTGSMPDSVCSLEIAPLLTSDCSIECSCCQQCYSNVSDGLRVYI